MLFARRIVLVEGIAEAVLLPVLARRLIFLGDRAKRRKFHAVTIVNVGSVDFEPYIRLLLGPVDGLTVIDHLVVITDSDPDPRPMKPDDAESRACNRAGPPGGRSRPNLGAGDRLTVAAATYTLEADLLGRADQRCRAPGGLPEAAFPLSQRSGSEIASDANPAEALYRKLRR